MFLSSFVCVTDKILTNGIHACFIVRGTFDVANSFPHLYELIVEFVDCLKKFFFYGNSPKVFCSGNLFYHIALKKRIE